MSDVVPAIRVLPRPEELAEAAAEMVVSAAAEAIGHEHDFVLAISGGSTPQRLFGLLSQEPWAARINWPRTHILFVDERCVAPADPQSNFGVAARLLFDRVPIPFEQVHRMAGEKEPSAAAAEYDCLLRERFDDGADLLLLGIGEDGHTASLFPGTAALGEREHRCVANYVAKMQGWRLTMTYPYINRARRVVVLAEGRAKSKVVNAALEGSGRPGELPIQAVRPLSQDMHWLLDAAAAGMFDEEEED